MKVHLVSHVTIFAMLPKIYRYLTNTKYHYPWNPHLRRVALNAILSLGASYESTSLLLGVTVKANNKVTKYLLKKELEFDNKTGSIHYSVNYKLVAEKLNTVLRCTPTVSSESNAFLYSVPLMRLLVRRELQSNLKALKIVVENNLK